MAASTRTYDVFISHAGPQKASFAAWLQRELQRRGVSTFLDERSLRLGDAADAEMESALRGCSIVVAVLTADFLRSSYCMQELHWALHSAQPHPVQPGNPSARQPAAGSATQQLPDTKQTEQQCSREPPLVLPVFYHTSDIYALQDVLRRRMSRVRMWFTPSARQGLKRAQADLDLVYNIISNRLDSQGK